MNQQQYAVLYSGRQQAFHVEPLEEHLVENRRRYDASIVAGDITNDGNDWVIIGLTDTPQEASRLCSEFQDQRNAIQRAGGK